MIRVGFDARVLAKPGVEGVIRYARELLAALVEREAAREAAEFEFHLFGLAGLPDALAGYDCVRAVGDPAWAHSGLVAHAWEQLSLPLEIAGHDLDVLHTPAGEPPVAASVPLVTTIHDLSPLVRPEWFARRYVALHRALLPLTVRRSDRIVAVSEFSKAEVESTYPRAAGKTVTVHNGARPPEPGGTPIEGLVPGEFLLFVGAANPRKNVSTLLRAYGRYRERVVDPLPLALAGPERAHFGDESRGGEDGGGAGRGGGSTAGVRSLGFVPDDQLRWLYHEAAAFVFPSRYEGFGLPILEAMGAGTPVITADRGAMAEVAGDAACLVDPESPTALAEAIEVVLDDRDRRRRLVERGRERAAEFTWERAAEGTEAVYREVAHEE